MGKPRKKKTKKTPTDIYRHDSKEVLKRFLDSGKKQFKEIEKIVASCHINEQIIEQLKYSLKQKTLENSELSHQNNQMSQAIGEISHYREIYMKDIYEKDNQIKELVRELEYERNKKEELVKENEHLSSENRKLSAENKSLIEDNEKLNKQVRVDEDDENLWDSDDSESETEDLDDAAIEQLRQRLKNNGDDLSSDSDDSESETEDLDDAAIEQLRQRLKNNGDDLSSDSDDSESEVEDLYDAALIEKSRKRPNNFKNVFNYYNNSHKDGKSDAKDDGSFFSRNFGYWMHPCSTCNGNCKIEYDTCSYCKDIYQRDDLDDLN